MSTNYLNMEVLKSSINLRKLSEEEETSLIIKAKQGNQYAQKKLISHYIKTISDLILPCKKNQRYDENDLLQEGVIGLIKAIHVYKPEKGFRFHNFVIPFIKKHIRDYTINNLFCVRVPAYLQTLYLKIKDIEDNYIENKTHEYPSLKYLSRRLNTSEDTIQKCLEVFDYSIFKELEENYEI